MAMFIYGRAISNGFYYVSWALILILEGKLAQNDCYYAASWVYKGNEPQVILILNIGLLVVPMCEPRTTTPIEENEINSILIRRWLSPIINRPWLRNG